MKHIWLEAQKSGHIEVRAAAEGGEVIESPSGDLTAEDGDLIARDPSNHDDQWVIKPGYFLENYQYMEEGESEPAAEAHFTVPPSYPAFTAHHYRTGDGAPAGGFTRGLGLDIVWQDGPLGTGADRIPPNGAFVEGVIAAAVDRLEYYQGTRFNCRENALAITKLQEALHWCGHRTADREARGVEGTHGV
jgi:hypothetical protein